MRTLLPTIMELTGIYRALRRNCRSFALCLGVAAVLAGLWICPAFAQSGLLTSRGDNTRSAANTNEILLTPGNVNKNNFGHLFSVPVDYQVLAQPLYVPNVLINTGPYLGTMHNVVYVATQMDSLYAFDADDGTQLWYTSEVVPGGAPASGQYLPCSSTGGFADEGIVGTPVSDPGAGPGTMYLVAKS